MGLLSVLLCFGLSSSVHAARRTPMDGPNPPVVQSDRVEVAVSRKDEWVVAPAGEEGLVLIGTDSRGAAWTMVGYSSDFQERWSASWQTDDRRMKLVDWTVEDGTLWAVLQRPKKPTVTLLQVDLRDGEGTTAGTVTAHEARSPVRLGLAESLAVVNDDVYVWASLRRQKPAPGTEGVLLRVDGAQHKAEPVALAEAVNARKAEIQRVVPDIDNGVVKVALATQHRRVRQVHAVSVRDGQVVDTRTLPPPADGSHNLLMAQRVHTGRADLMVGTYASGAKGQAAQGLFVSALDDSGHELWRRTTSFSDLDRFFDYLPKRRQDRVESRAARKKDRGADLKLQVMLNLHDVVEQDGRFLVIGEAYHPEYQVQQRTVTVVQNGVTTTQTETVQVFVGYRTTHAVVVALDAEGRRVWDASFAVGNILSRQVEDRVRVSVDGDRVTMVYAHDGKVFSKVARADGMVDGEKHAQRAASEDGGKVKRGVESHTEHWYGDRFLVYGKETVKGGEEGRHKVFAFTSFASAPVVMTGTLVEDSVSE